MAILRVNPNRMELNNLKEKLELAKRGHSLLKDKQDGLMKQFISMIRENQRLRRDVEEELIYALREFMLASSNQDPRIIEQAISFPDIELLVDIKTKNSLSVKIPEMTFIKKDRIDDKKDKNIYHYGFIQTSEELDKAIKGLEEVLDKLLKLGELEKTSQLLADEIEKTRRRVNALEYRTIPDYIETINYVRMKLDENERSTLVRLMKVKEMNNDDKELK